jgi:RNA polymerase sigma-70 factor (ECF subfamily)
VLEEMRQEPVLSEAERQKQFLDLLMPFYPRALAYCQTLSGSLIDGEDLLSDAVLKAYSCFHQLRDVSRFKEWFFSILLNRFRNLRSRTLLRPTMLMGDLSGPNTFWEATARVSGDPAELGYQLTLVQELLRRLSPPEREVLLLLGPCGFTPAEVAAMQNTGERAVIQRAYRARRKLEKMVPEGALPFIIKRAEVGNE